MRAGFEGEDPAEVRTGGMRGIVAFVGSKRAGSG